MAIGVLNGFSLIIGKQQTNVIFSYLLHYFTTQTIISRRKFNIFTYFNICAKLLIIMTSH